jgi:hypothetical protein
MDPRRFIPCSLPALALAAALAPLPAAGQSLLDRVQGLYYPPNQGTWDCATLGTDGGAVGVQGDVLHGVENSCTLANAFPIPGMDAMMFSLACTGEGLTYDGGNVILVPTETGLGLVRDGSVNTWLRCP